MHKHCFGGGIGGGGGGAKEGQTKFIMGDVQMANAWFFLKHWMKTN